MKYIKILLCSCAFFIHNVFAQDFDYPIVVDRELFAKPNDEVSFSCQLSSEDLVDPNRCLFITPQKLRYVANITDGLVYDENALVVPAFTAFGDGRTCGLHSEEFQSIFAGQWHCILNEAPSHLASFHIFMEDEEATHVQDGIRLPKHVIPTFYEVELSPRIEEGDLEVPGTMKVHSSVDPDEDDHVMRKIVLHGKNTRIISEFQSAEANFETIVNWIQSLTDPTTETETTTAQKARTTTPKSTRKTTRTTRKTTTRRTTTRRTTTKKPTTTTKKTTTTTTTTTTKRKTTTTSRTTTRQKTTEAEEDEEETEIVTTFAPATDPSISTSNSTEEISNTGLALASRLYWEILMFGVFLTTLPFLFQY